MPTKKKTRPLPGATLVLKEEFFFLSFCAIVGDRKPDPLGRYRGRKGPAGRFAGPFGRFGSLSLETLLLANFSLFGGIFLGGRGWNILSLCRHPKVSGLRQRFFFCFIPLKRVLSLSDFRGVMLNVPTSDYQQGKKGRRDLTRCPA